MISRLACLVALASLPAAAQQEWTVENVRDKFKTATVFIEAERDGRVIDLGTGVVITDQGHVLTAKHLFECPDCTQARFFGRIGERASTFERFELVDREEDTQFDVAILKFSRPAKWTTAPMRVVSTPQGKLFALGFPLLQPYSGVSGEYTGAKNDWGGWRTTLPITRGNSGGPVFDDTGKVIGLSISGVPNEPYKTILPLALAADLLKKIGVALEGAFPKQDINVFIDVERMTGGNAATADMVKQAVRSMWPTLKKGRIVDSPADAKYKLTQLQLVPDRHLVMLKGSFLWPGAPQDDFWGKCPDCQTITEAASYVFADLLHKTLLHHVRGPYGVVTIEKCQPKPDSTKMVLSLRSSGVGLEKGFYYELGGQDPHGDLNSTGAWMDIEDMLQDEGGRGARALFRKITSGVKAPHRCNPESRTDIGEVLLPRLMQRPVPISTRNSDPRGMN